MGVCPKEHLVGPVLTAPVDRTNVTVMWIIEYSEMVVSIYFIPLTLTIQKSCIKNHFCALFQVLLKKGHLVGPKFIEKSI